MSAAVIPQERLMPEVCRADDIGELGRLS